MSSLTVSTINALNPTAGVAIPQFVPASQFSHRNKIINGKMDIAQRGTSFAAIASGAYSLDRWRVDYSTGSVATVSQQSDAPSNNEFQNSLRVAVTTADSSIGSTEFFTVRQRIEGYNARDLIGRTFTLSFWVRSSKTGIHCVAFRNSVSDRSLVLEYTINSANTWEYKTLLFGGGLITAGTWDWTSGIGLELVWTLAAGSSLVGSPAASWLVGGAIATANQVNCLDSTSNIFAITGVQLEPGSVATPFEHRPFGAELALCQRYYVRYATNSMVLGNGHLNGATQYDVVGTFPVTMRTAPTATALNVGSIQVKLPGGSAQSITNVTAFLNSTIGYRVYGDMPSFGSIGQGCYLFSNADGRGFEFSSEL